MPSPDTIDLYPQPYLACFTTITYCMFLVSHILSLLEKKITKNKALPGFMFLPLRIRLEQSKQSKNIFWISKWTNWNMFVTFHSLPNSSNIQFRIGASGKPPLSPHVWLFLLCAPRAACVVALINNIIIVVSHYPTWVCKLPGSRQLLPLLLKTLI